MNGISGIDSSLYLAGNALSVHSVGMQVSAHNVANISTDDFVPQRATYATGHNGTGVELESVRKLDPPQGVRPAVESVSDSIHPAGMGVSGTELAREMPHMMTTQRAFEANAAVIRTSEDMSATILNLIA